MTGEYSGGNSNGPSQRTITWHLIWTWIQTLLGSAIMVAMVLSALLYFGLPFSWGVALLLLSLLVPVAGWYNSSTIVKKLTACQPPDPQNPQHARLIRIVDKLYPKTGLPVKPPVYVSPLPVPNAFATGRTPSDALIAATEGLFLCDLTDDELEGILAHELAHVKNWDVALNSTLSVLSSLFGIILAASFPRLFQPAFISGQAPLLTKLSSRVKMRRKLVLPTGGLAGFVIMLIVFYLVSAFAKFVSLFVVRARESAADAKAAQWTGKPCALSMALQKITIFMQSHSSDLRVGIVSRGLVPMFIVNPLARHEVHFAEEPSGPFGRLRRWWRNLGDHHPPIRDRIAALDRMNGRYCPRLLV